MPKKLLDHDPLAPHHVSMHLNIGEWPQLRARDLEAQGVKDPETREVSPTSPAIVRRRKYVPRLF